MGQRKDWGFVALPGLELTPAELTLSQSLEPTHLNGQVCPQIRKSKAFVLMQGSVPDQLSSNRLNPGIRFKVWGLINRK